VLPKTRPEFWAAKLEGNAARDRHAVAALRGAGWRVIVVWECELRKPETALPELLQALTAAPPNE